MSMPAPLTLITLPTLEQQVHAPPDAAYARFCDPGCAGGPWHVPGAIVEVKVGGLFYFVIEYQGSWTHYGRFIELTPGKRVVFAWVSRSTRGHESIVSVDFAADGAGSLIRLTHAQVPDDALGRQHSEGWAGVLETFARSFE
jgi:uncharacterized protein YndB with AHSA1/START domain